MRTNSSKKDKPTSVLVVAPERPNVLASKKVKCGQCLYFRGRHPKFKSDCQDIFSVEKSTVACVDFEYRINAHHYRKDLRILHFLEMASRYEGAQDLASEVKSLTGRVFSRSEIRSGKSKSLARVREVLFRSKDTSALVSFFDEVQRYRDRVSEIQSQAIEWKGDIDLLWREAESYLYSRYVEVTRLKPEGLRISTTRSILSEVYSCMVRVDALSDQCDAALKNLSAEHNALMEIQACARSPVLVSSIPKSQRKIRGDYIARKADRTL
jgi:hypothetical protein